MTKNNNDGGKAADIRKRAEAFALESAARIPENLDALPPEDMKRLMHELRVHQIELEMQNEELRESQADLETSKARYFDLYDLAPVGYCTISDKGLILEANLTAAGLLGVSRGALAGRLLSDFILTEDQDAYYLRRKRLFETGELQPCELRMARKDGSQFWARLETAIAESADGARVCRVVISDITERKNDENAQTRYLEQDKMATVGKVAGKMAHDFNNILGVIMGISELLQAGNLPPDVRADIDIIHDSALKGKDLTRNLLLFARDQETKLSQFDLNDKITLVIQSLKSDLKGVQVNASYGADMENLLADAGLLENAVINLIQNSIHAMSKTETPTLNIKTYAENNNICVEIEDNGCGIPDECKDMIFEPTFTLKGSGDRTGAYRRDIKGSGYGMTNVKQCVDKHGGTIEFESAAGKGATFRIKLPIIKGAFSAEEIEAVRKQDIVEGKRILIVEDEPHLGRILHSLLEKFNHRIDLSIDGKIALNYLKRNAYDAVSLDFILPDMNGMEIYRKIRETNRDVPIIFVSGNFEFMQSMIDLKREDPKVDLLSKPFSNVEYVNMIHKWLAE